MALILNLEVFNAEIKSFRLFRFQTPKKVLDKKTPLKHYSRNKQRNKQIKTNKTENNKKEQNKTGRKRVMRHPSTCMKLTY